MSKIKAFLFKVVMNTLAFVLTAIIAGSICRTMYDLFMFGYNLGH